MVISSTPRPARHRRSSLTCSGCAGQVPTRTSLTTGAVEHLAAGFVLACSASAAVTQPLPADWFVPAARVAKVDRPAPSAAVKADGRMQTQRISFDAAAELARWSVLA